MLRPSCKTLQQHGRVLKGGRKSRIAIGALTADTLTNQNSSTGISRPHVTDFFLCFSLFCFFFCRVFFLLAVRRLMDGRCNYFSVSLAGGYFRPCPGALKLDYRACLRSPVFVACASSFFLSIRPADRACVARRSIN